MIADLLPAYFALVMATGVVAIAAATLGMAPAHVAAPRGGGDRLRGPVGAERLRLARYPGRVLADLPTTRAARASSRSSPATCILGTASVVLQRPAIAAVLWALGLVLWFIVMYAFFTAVVAREHKPSLEAGINGAWLIAAVATQSIVGARLACVADQFGAGREIVLFVSLALFLIGAHALPGIITLIFYRFTFVL